MRILKGDDAELRKMAVRGMNVAMTDKLVTELRPFLDDEDTQIAVHILGLLARSKHPDRLAWIRERLRDSSHQLRRAAIMLLLAQDHEHTIDDILPLFEDDDP